MNLKYEPIICVISINNNFKGCYQQTSSKILKRKQPSTFILMSRGLGYGDSSKNNTQFGRTSHLRTTHMSKGYTKGGFLLTLEIGNG